MKIAFNVNRLIDTELHFAKRFTQVIQKPYGLIYWNEANKESHDSNHAIITDYVGVEASIKDITNFYRFKGIVPRVYSAMKDREAELLVPHLESNGFVVESTTDQYFLWQSDSRIEPVHGIHCQKITSLDMGVREFLSQPDFGDWAVKVLERHLRHPGFHLLGGYVQDELVTIASVNVFEGYSRVDDVLTHHFYRGKGYSSALMHYLVNYHKSISENWLYLYSAVPQAIKIYLNAGFAPIEHEFKVWRAHKPLQ